MLLSEWKGQVYDLEKRAIDMTPEERAALSDQGAAGEFLRRGLIRFGYLSEEERRRLITIYPDIERRFERPIRFETFMYQTIAIFSGFIMGLVFAGAPVVLYVIGTVLYWVPAAWLLRLLEKGFKERTEEYWEWRGYRCDSGGGRLFK